MTNTYLITLADNKFHSEGGEYTKKISTLQIENNQLLPKGFLIDVDGNVSVVISKTFIDWAYEKLKEETK